jgi:beta-lactamase superfamily II metal-dependent hydrolase
MRVLLIGLVTLCLSSFSNATTKPLEIYFVDVEGGQATLFVTPAGQSLLIDTGWDYNAYRDAIRITKAAKAAGIKRIDYVLITHYHEDHVGGVPQLAAKMPVGTFIDHGPNRETTPAGNHLYEEYEKAIAGKPHMVAKPGETLPIKGIEAVFVSGDGNLIDKPLAGAGQENVACSGVQQHATDPTENARSVGTAMTFGQLRIVDLGDLTWNKELELMCPTNKLGHADILIVSHHGSDLSNSPALVHDLKPRVAVIDNGSKKGNSPSAWDIVKATPGLLDIWQLHFADAGGSEHNTQDPFIANTQEADTGFYLKLTAHEDGSFEIYNQRNKFSKDYPAK